MVSHYIIDSCSFVEINRNNPLDVFPTLWKRLAQLAKQSCRS